MKGDTRTNGLPSLLALTAVLCAAILSACGHGAEVPYVADPSQPLDADGKMVTPIEFLDKYCKDNIVDSTCAMVRKAHLRTAKQQ